MTRATCILRVYPSLIKFLYFWINPQSFSSSRSFHSNNTDKIELIYTLTLNCLSRSENQKTSLGIKNMVLLLFWNFGDVGFQSTDMKNIYIKTTGCFTASGLRNEAVTGSFLDF